MTLMRCSFTVISLTLSLIAVFIPLLFMTGLVGRMFREFALTLTIAVVASAIVSLTLTPMMCARLLKRHGGDGQNTRARGGLSRRLTAVVDRTVERYHLSLLWVLRRQPEPGRAFKPRVRARNVGGLGTAPVPAEPPKE